MLALAAVLATVPVASAVSPSPGVSPGAGMRYATDAYPGFDTEKDIVSPERKSPRWFAFLFGPKRENARDQFAYCQELVSAGDFSGARKQLDALVREWPTAPEAVKAQQQLAQLLLERLQDTEEAFAEYRYLLDFYSLQCDYDAIADRLYKIAGQLRVEGKELMFVRFENVVDVRRAYEACVLHAPGAAWVPQALLTIAELRERESKFLEAVKVYENLRNLYPDVPEAKVSILREAEVRMRVLDDFGYNRLRCQDTLDFLRLSLRGCRPEDSVRIQALLDQVLAKCEEEDYRGAKFYDSTTRTPRSAIGAYEKFLCDHPRSKYAEAVRTRLRELKGGDK